MKTDMDGVYNRRRWDDEPEVWSYSGPFASFQEQLTQQALSVMFMTGPEIQESVRPPLLQIDPFRPRFGYPPVEERQATVDQIVSGVSRIIPARASWYSGGPAGYTGAPRYASNNIGLF